MIDPATGIADPLGPAPKVGERAPAQPAPAAAAPLDATATPANELPPAGEAAAPQEDEQTRE